MRITATTVRCSLVLRPVTLGKLVLAWEWQPLPGTSEAWKNKANRNAFDESLHAIAWALLHGLTVSQDFAAVDGIGLES